jgi:hypothetical protein
MTLVMKLISSIVLAGFLNIFGFWLIWLAEAFFEEKDESHHP